MDYKKDLAKMSKIDRKRYIEIYHKLGSQMFTECYCPNVGDFANAFGKKNGKSAESMEKIEHITKFTGNGNDIVNSARRTQANYSEAESSKFMNSVIAANVTSITESGFFYKKLVASCDNMRIDLDYDDCKSTGVEMTLPIDEETYNFKVRNHFINELDDYTESYDDFVSKTKDMTEVHIRNFLTCKHSKNHRTFCKRCAGLYRREHNSSFTPKYIGVYSTLMITEHATQASLDSMNKGASEKLNVLLEQPISEKDTQTYDDVKKLITDIIDQIGDIGVESRFYEIALLSRMYLKKNGTYKPAAMVTSFLNQNDEFGSFIYRPSKQTFAKMLSADKIEAKSLKTSIAFDNYDD